jgi:hypothetical protein
MDSYQSYEYFDDYDDYFEYYSDEDPDDYDSSDNFQIFEDHTPDQISHDEGWNHDAANQELTSNYDVFDNIPKDDPEFFTDTTRLHSAV